jgi:transcription elongation GreA/GreB family factor
MSISDATRRRTIVDAYQVGALQYRIGWAVMLLEQGNVTEAIEYLKDSERAAKIGADSYAERTMATPSEVQG